MDNKDFHKGVRCTRLAREFTRLHLAQHGWNITDAFNRLSAGKGLLSNNDKKALELYRNCLVQFRRCGMPTIKYKANIQELAAWCRNRLTPWRTVVSKHIQQQIAELEAGQRPIYLRELHEFRYYGGNDGSLDIYYLLKVNGEKDNEKIQRVISDLLAKTPKQLAQCSLSVDAEHPKVTYDSRYTVRCRLNEMPTFGGNKGVKQMVVPEEGEPTEITISFSNFIRDNLNYIYDIPGKADQNLLSSIEDNLNRLKTLREHLAAVANSPVMDKATMEKAIESLDRELDSFAWPL